MALHNVEGSSMTDCEMQGSENKRALSLKNLERAEVEKESLIVLFSISCKMFKIRTGKTKYTDEVGVEDSMC
jgi:hypothetical protein